MSCAVELNRALPATSDEGARSGRSRTSERHRGTAEKLFHRLLSLILRTQLPRPRRESAFEKLLGLSCDAWGMVPLRVYCFTYARHSTRHWWKVPEDRMDLEGAVNEALAMFFVEPPTTAQTPPGLVAWLQDAIRSRLRESMRRERTLLQARPLLVHDFCGRGLTSSLLAWYDPLAFDEPDDDASSIDAGLCDRVESLVHKLSPKLRETAILVLLECPESSLKQVADVLGVEPPAVRQRWSRARRRLQELLDDVRPARRLSYELVRPRLASAEITSLPGQDRDDWYRDDCRVRSFWRVAEETARPKEAHGGPVVMPQMQHANGALGFKLRACVV